MNAGPQPGDPAPDATLLDAEGRRVQLSSFWQEQRVVLVFLRYFGCPFCQVHVVKLREDQQLFHEAGAEVVLVGQGSPEEGAGFCQRKHLPFPCLLDGDKSAYRAYGLRRRNLAVVISPRIAVPFVRANLNSETRQRGLEGGTSSRCRGRSSSMSEGSSAWRIATGRSPTALPTTCCWMSWPN